MARYVLLSALFVSTPLLAADVEPGPDASADAKKMQGTWSVVSANGPGKVPGDIKKDKLVIEKDEMKVVHTGGREERAKFKLAVKKGVGLLDLRPGGDPKTVLGLYKLEKDTLTITLPGPGGERPEKIGDPKAMTIVLKRDKK
jgi:uncharacterized protein (TIGR03067 family)